MIETTWYVLPLTACIALVYNASRYELPARILQRAGRMFLTILAGLAALYVVLYLLSVRL